MERSGIMNRKETLYTTISFMLGIIMILVVIYLFS